MQQTPVGKRQYLLRRQRVTAVFAEGLLGRQTLRHRLITMDSHRQNAPLALQPQLIQILLQLAADAQIVNQNIAIDRQRLLMETNMAIAVRVDHDQRAVADVDQGAGQRGITVRQVNQQPAVIALLVELLHDPGHRRQRRLEPLNIFALARRQLTKRQQIDMRSIAQPGVAPVGAVDRGARPARFVAEIDVEKKRSMLSGLASTTSTVSPSNRSARASAAVIDVVPVPPRTPCNPRIAIDGFLTFLC